jgi:hypothetical protein
LPTLGARRSDAGARGYLTDREMAADGRPPPSAATIVDIAPLAPRDCEVWRVMHVYCALRASRRQDLGEWRRVHVYCGLHASGAALLAGVA